MQAGNLTNKFNTMNENTKLTNMSDEPQNPACHIVCVNESVSTKCRNCGKIHPLVAEFGLCGKCALLIYDIP